MITYVYETVPQTPGAKTRHYAIQQNREDAPLVTHPQTGEPIRRVVLGDLGELTLPERNTGAEDNYSSACPCGCSQLPWFR